MTHALVVLGKNLKSVMENNKYEEGAYKRAGNIYH